MKKILFFLFAIITLCKSSGFAQNYFVSSLAIPGAATFYAGQDKDDIISLPSAAGTYNIIVATNQEAAVVNTNADWCDASMKGKSLILTLKENSETVERSTVLTLNSKDFHSNLLRIRQKAQSPVLNYFIQNFANRTKGKSESFVKKEQGKINAIKKAYQLTEFPFKPVGVIENNRGSYLPDIEYKGIIYSSTKELGTCVPNAVSFYTFATAVRNPRSKLYTDKINNLPYHGTNCRAYYGTVCSSLVSYALGTAFNSYGFNESDLMEDIGYQVPEDVEVGDVLWITGHVAIITDMIRDKNNRITMVEVSEATQGGCVRNQYSRQQLESIMINRFEKVLRYKFYEKNIQYEAFPQLVPVAGEEFIPIEFNDDLCVDKGDRSNYLIGEDVTINIFSPYDSVVVYKDNERYTSFTKDNNSDITLIDLPYGMYSASLWSNHHKSKETSWMMVDYNVSYSKGEQAIYLSSKNAVPTSIRQCALSGAQGSKVNQLISKSFTSEEQASRSIAVPSGHFSDGDYSYFQIKFKTVFGTVSTRPIKFK